MDIRASLQNMNNSVNRFFTFIAGKLKNFKNLSLGEQIAYPCVGVGLLLMVVSLVMFILF